MNPNPIRMRYAARDGKQPGVLCCYVICVEGHDSEYFPYTCVQVYKWTLERDDQGELSMKSLKENFGTKGLKYAFSKYNGADALRIHYNIMNYMEDVLEGHSILVDASSPENEYLRGGLTEADYKTITQSFDAFDICRPYLRETDGNKSTIGGLLFS